MAVSWTYYAHILGGWSSENLNPTTATVDIINPTSESWTKPPRNGTTTHYIWLFGRRAVISNQQLFAPGWFLNSQYHWAFSLELFKSNWLKAWWNFMGLSPEGIANAIKVHPFAMWGPYRSSHNSAKLNTVILLTNVPAIFSGHS